MDEAAASLGLAEWKELGGACNDLSAIWCDGSVVKLGRSVNSGTGTALLRLDKVELLAVLGVSGPPVLPVKEGEL